MEDKSLYEILSASALHRYTIDHIVDRVTAAPALFPELYAITSDADTKTAHHAWWAVEKVSYKLPALFTEKREELRQLALHTSHEGIRRMVLNILLFLPKDSNAQAQFPEEEMHFLNYCLDEMLSPQRAAAVQALLLKHAYHICKDEPDLRNELALLLENVEPEYYTPAVTSTVRNLYKKLKKSRRK